MDNEEKRRRRLEKNKIAARECRKRKKEQMEKLEQEINLLEAENLRLKIKLRVGDEGEQVDEMERERVHNEIDSLLQSGDATDSEISAMIEKYRQDHADYGLTRRSALEYHLRNVEKLLQPSPHTTILTTASYAGKVRTPLKIVQSKEKKCSIHFCETGSAHAFSCSRIFFLSHIHTHISF